MGDRDAPDQGLPLLVALAEAIEQGSREGHPVVWLLDDLEEATDRTCRRLAPADADDIDRWRRVMTSVRRAVETGRVRSVSGIAREARRLAARVERRDHVVLP
jgi:hypothetical protein